MPDDKEIVPITNERGETRQYETVASRVKRFRSEHPDFAIKTGIYAVDAESVIMYASIGWYMDGGTYIELATGFAEEWRNASDINLTSAVENAETSAIGRALAALGYMSTDSFASAQEIQRAQTKKRVVEDARPGALILLQQAAAQGTAKLQHTWEKVLSKPDRQACRNDLVSLQRQAREVDQQYDKQFEQTYDEGTP